MVTNLRSQVDVYMTSVTNEPAQLVALQPSAHALAQNGNLLPKAPKIRISNTTVWQVINLGMSINKLKFRRSHV